MEINRFDDVTGVVAQEDIVEGRFVLFTTQAMGGTIVNVDADLPGAKLPDTAEEAKRARYCIAFSVDNRPVPIMDLTTTEWDFYGGYTNAPAGPLTGKTIWLTHPGNQEGQTIPSGYKALAFGPGTFTLPSGQYIYDANLETPGALLIVADTASDSAAEAGMPKYQATAAVGVVGEVQKFNSDDASLTIKLYG